MRGRRTFRNSQNNQLLNLQHQELREARLDMEKTLLSQGGENSENAGSGLGLRPAAKGGWGKLRNAVKKVPTKQKVQQKVFRRRLRVRLASRVASIFVGSSYDETISIIIGLALNESLDKETAGTLLTQIICALTVFFVCLVINFAASARLKKHRKTLEPNSNQRYRLPAQRQTIISITAGMSSVISSWNAQKALTDVCQFFLGTSVPAELAAFGIVAVVCAVILYVFVEFFLDKARIMKTKALSVEAESVTTYVCLMVSLAWCTFCTISFKHLGGLVTDDSFDSLVYSALMLWGYAFVNFAIFYVLTTKVIKFQGAEGGVWRRVFEYAYGEMAADSVGIIFMDAMTTTVALVKNQWLESGVFAAVAVGLFLFVFFLSGHLQKTEDENLRLNKPPRPRDRILVLWAAAIAGKACSASGHSLLQNSTGLLDKQDVKEIILV